MEANRRNEAQQGKDRVRLEGPLLDQKSLRAVTGKTADWNEIAKDCIPFGNARAVVCGWASRMGSLYRQRVIRYQLAQGNTRTNLGVLCLSLQHHRAQLTTAPVIPFIKCDEHGGKVKKEHA